MNLMPESKVESAGVQLSMVAVEATMVKTCSNQVLHGQWSDLQASFQTKTSTQFEVESFLVEPPRSIPGGSRVCTTLVS